MVPEYVVKKSIAAIIKVRLVLFTIITLLLLIPPFMVKGGSEASGLFGLWFVVFVTCAFCWLVCLVKIVKAKHFVIEFYHDKVITKSGVIAKHEKQTAFFGVYSVSVHQSMSGRMFDFGDVVADVRGKWDINTRKIKAPKELKEYLESKIVTEGVSNIITN